MVKYEVECETTVIYYRSIIAENEIDAIDIAETKPWSSWDIKPGSGKSHYYVVGQEEIKEEE